MLEDPEGNQVGATKYDIRQRPLDLFDGEALDVVADLDVLEARELHAALHPRGDLGHLVLEALERLQGAEFQDHHIPANDPDAGAPAHHALAHPAAGDAGPPLEMSKA